MKIFSIADYLVHVGQLQAVTKSTFGDDVVSTVTTIACYVYQETDQRKIQDPRQTPVGAYSALLPSSAVVAENYVLANVVGRGNVPILPSAKVTRIIQYNDWQEGLRFIQVALELN